MTRYPDWKQWWRKASVLLAVKYAYMLEYRAELWLWVLAGSLPLILMGVWYQAGQAGQFALSSVQFVRYFLAVFLVRQFTIVWVIWDFEREVVEGTLSPRLLQPLDPVWHHVAGHLSERLARLPFSLGLVVLFFALYPDAFWLPSVTTVVLFVVAIVGTFILRFLMAYTLSMFCFWTERAAALEDLSFLFYLFLSGMIAPLTVFPAEIQQILLWTPFPYMIHFPASILVGIPVHVGTGLGVMGGWIAVFAVLNRWLWRQGLKHYAGMGA